MILESGQLRPVAGASPSRALAGEAEGHVCLVAEHIGGRPDEATKIFVREVALRLSRLRPVLIYALGGEPAEGMLLFPNRRPLLSVRFIRDLRRRRPAAVVNFYSPTLPGLLRLWLMRKFSRARCTLLVCLLPGHVPARLRPLARRLLPDSLLISTAADREKAATYAGERVHPISAGIDVGRFRPIPRDGVASLRRELGLPLDKTVVLHVGHLLRSRNLEALEVLAAQPDLSVVVLVGGDRDAGSDDLKRELEGKGVHVIDEYLPAKEKLYQAADCYVFPVREMGAIQTPLTVLEALASELPVVTTRYGALVDHFTGEGALKFIDEDEELLPAVREQLAERPPGRHLVETWSWDGVAGAIAARLVPEHG